MRTCVRLAALLLIGAGGIAAGNLYVSSLSSSTILEFGGVSGVNNSNFYGTIPPGNGLAVPIDLTFGPDGKLYIVNLNGADVLQYDGSTGAFLGVFAATHLVHPHFLTFGPDGNLYVSDPGNGTVEEFNGQTGAFIQTFISGLANPLG